MSGFLVAFFFFQMLVREINLTPTRLLSTLQEMNISDLIAASYPIVSFSANCLPSALLKCIRITCKSCLSWFYWCYPAAWFVCAEITMPEA